MERPAWQDELDPSKYNLKAIIGTYSFAKKDQLPCGLKNCRTKHQNGYVVVTVEGVETHIGNRCGAKYFGVNWGDIKAQFARDVEADAQQKWLDQILQTKQPLIERGRRIVDSLKAMTAKVQKVRKALMKERQLWSAFRDAAKAGGQLFEDRKVSREYAEAMGLRERDRVQRIKVGQIYGIEMAIEPRGDTRLRGEAMISSLQAGDIPFLEGLSEESLRTLNPIQRKAKVKQLEGIQARFQQGEKYVAQTQQFLTDANLRELSKLPVSGAAELCAEILESFANTKG